MLCTYVCMYACNNMMLTIYQYIVVVMSPGSAGASGGHGCVSKRVNVSEFQDVNKLFQCGFNFT